jgi:hypothetical protein
MLTAPFCFSPCFPGWRNRGRRTYITWPKSRMADRTRANISDFLILFRHMILVSFSVFGVGQFNGSATVVVGPRHVTKIQDGGQTGGDYSFRLESDVNAIPAVGPTFSMSSDRVTHSAKTSDVRFISNRTYFRFCSHHLSSRASVGVAMCRCTVSIGTRCQRRLN